MSPNQEDGTAVVSANMPSGFQGSENDTNEDTLKTKDLSLVNDEPV